MHTREHLAKYGKQVIVPTKAMLKHWFHRLNRDIWDGILPAPDRISLRPGKGNMACFERRLDNKGWYLGFTNQPMSRYALLEILAHEMVHCAHWALDGEARGNHGPQFMSYAGLLASKVGLPLRDGFYGEPEELCLDT